MRRTVGLGLRREFLADVLEQAPAVGFWELAPENWFPRGAHAQRTLDRVREQAPLTSHGLSLSIGSPDPIDVEFVKQVKRFLDRFDIKIYSEHLSYCSAEGHLYDLLPMPFTTEAASYVAERVRQVQDIIERPLVLENVSYYANFGGELTEQEFICQVLEEADCRLLLDVNNVFVNSVNHRYDPREFIRSMPSERIVYGHIAGHSEEYDDLFVDTHGADVKPDVWRLLDYAYQCHGLFPTVLERDFNIPPLPELLQEAAKVANCQHNYEQEQRVEAVSTDPA
ncbi:DUF692 domain-containing protein [Pseudidiomarina terrestris]|uniref:DUF692 domain-containing protein n=1 Tax=Pseudidiomarina terrestris TaxID=2820060 RepID=A0AAW7QVG6_9GAMM|nr:MULTISPECIES: DUF692 domain-containing protein [unclassified Pseudidiomarina]MDN7123396.1 DUF692 domain-containing protein [Pseudidiomarina sp. 1APP75-32.1]MDN7127772.1 DUF692 domain-containing protein [Pseudidiomarina sp. 1APR75-33.1]MDN7128879.1 DUF692 domain-containing protein [Pseudidiomarina sp. 1APR75-15]MDN7134858.1 DUF692 domain-containing protein [Pseudidiomarina sp. 1ASP75-5]MDN7137536.1 DUF692 domain-containing protein [Pseudidiomarina sp. 1ASP75-14]